MLKAYRRYAQFEGRSNRAEYWLFVLTYAIAFCVALAIDFLVFGDLTQSAGMGPFSGIVILASVVPSIAVGVRRLHDLDRTGFWLLISFVPFIGALAMLVVGLWPGTPGPNRFGPPEGAPAQDLQATFS